MKAYIKCKACGEVGVAPSVDCLLCARCTEANKKAWEAYRIWNEIALSEFLGIKVDIEDEDVSEPDREFDPGPEIDDEGGMSEYPDPGPDADAPERDEGQERGDGK
jgi:hypothetical protein